MAQWLVLPIIVIWFFIIARKAKKNAFLWAIGGGAIYFLISSIIGGALFGVYFAIGDLTNDTQMTVAVVLIAAAAILGSVVCLIWVKNRYILGSPSGDNTETPEEDSARMVTCPACESELELDDEEVRAGAYTCPDCHTRVELAKAPAGAGEH